ncbi:hypothetical protein QAD02_012924 [Eretmocerus hayati]|uniref:Uncharacterized protein n=1 Tax=Eretmocerus hayati TaxID=131215 RepID=A0ACC2P190_9HYME|nr:hypothetical protein QAD02_012924 [Eretmocerus hayati]
MSASEEHNYASSTPIIIPESILTDEEDFVVFVENTGISWNIGNESILPDFETFCPILQRRAAQPVPKSEVLSADSFIRSDPLYYDIPPIDLVEDLPPVLGNQNVTPVFYLDATEVDLQFKDGLSVITELDCQEEKLPPKNEEPKVFDDSTKFENASLADLDRIQSDEFFVVDGVLTNPCRVAEICDCEIIECRPPAREIFRCDNDTAPPLLAVQTYLTVEEYADIERLQVPPIFPGKRQRGRPKGKRLPRTKSSKQVPRTEKTSIVHSDRIATQLHVDPSESRNAGSAVTSAARENFSSIEMNAASWPRRSLSRIALNQPPCRRSERLRLARSGLPSPNAAQVIPMLEKDEFEVSTPELPPVTNFTRPTVIVSTSSIGIVPKVDTVRPKPKITNVVTITKGILPLVEKTKPQISIASAGLDNCADAGTSTISQKIALNFGEMSSTELQTPEPRGVDTRLQDAQLRAPSGREADPLIYYLTRHIGYPKATYRFIVLNIRDFKESYAAVSAVRKEIHELKKRITQRKDRLNSMVRDVRCRGLSCNAHTGYPTRVTAVICSKCITLLRRDQYWDA